VREPGKIRKWYKYKTRTKIRRLYKTS